jgi:YebC/PmpR family DNA-binding regulatory protein
LEPWAKICYNLKGLREVCQDLKNSKREKMSGHSKWSTIKRQKGAKDLRRGRLFSKLAKAITLAAKSGSDPEGNFKLRLAIDRAKGANMPKDNIDRAISRAQAGAKGEGRLVEITFEGYGPGGVAIMIQTATDSRQRAISEVKRVLEKAGGGLGEKGCVAYLFQPRGVMTVKTAGRDPEEVMLSLIDLGVQDIDRVGEAVIVYLPPNKLEEIKEQILNQGLAVETATVNLEPKTAIKIDDTRLAAKLLALTDELEELDDTQEVYANFDIPEKILAEVSEKNL